MTVTAPAPANTNTNIRQGVMHDLNDPDNDIRWNPDVPATVEAAAAVFARHVGKGAIAYRSNDPQDGGEQIREFDPDAAVIVVVRPLQGG